MSLISRFVQLKATAANITRRYLSTNWTQNVSRIPPVASTTNHWIYIRNEQINPPPVSHHHQIIELPNCLKWVVPPPPLKREKTATILDQPDEVSNTAIEAARMIVIRRKKMKKHKLRKLRKRMKYEWAKLRQRRELKKERAFQAELIKQCKEAEAFSAEKYVQERLDKLNEIVIPRFWKGRRLPEFLIREKMGLPPK